MCVCVCVCKKDGFCLHFYLGDMFVPVWLLFYYFCLYLESIFVLSLIFFNFRNYNFFDLYHFLSGKYKIMSQNRKEKKSTFLSFSVFTNLSGCSIFLFAVMLKYLLLFLFKLDNFYAKIFVFFF